MSAGVERPPPTGLPVEDVIDDVRAALAIGSAVLQAEPGAGKTTVVPLRLLGEPWVDHGRIVVLEPRRVAARAAASRMAALLGEEVGATVGLVTRDDRRTGKATRVEVVTEGVLTRRLQTDPSLPGTALVVFDEFHERHLQSDLGLAFTLDARDGLRPDLRVLVMSATLNAGPVSALLDGAPVITSAGRSFPVEVRWAPMPTGGRLATGVAAAVFRALAVDAGDLLVFLPGVGEIRAVTDALGTPTDFDVVTLHGGLPAAAQDIALRAGGRRRVVLATDLAETSVTVEGAGVVIDAGLARRPYYDPAGGLTRLRTAVASRASADQRAGRAGRLGPGVAYRLWSAAEHDRRRLWPDPEISSADLAGLALELAVWGAAPGDLRWLDPPPPAAYSTAVELLEELGALAGGRPTDLGQRLAGIPLHPRLAAMLVTAPRPAQRTAALLAALLSERDILRRDGSPATVDISDRLAVLGGAGRHRADIDRAAVAVVRRRADELVRRAGGPTPNTGRSKADVTDSWTDAGPLLAAAYPDRIAKSRGAGRYRLRHGGGAALPGHDPIAGAQWLVVADVDGAAGLPVGTDGRIRLAAVIDRADVERAGGRDIRTEARLEWDDGNGDLRMVTARTLGALVLDTTRGPAPPGPDTTAALVAYAIDSGLDVLGWTSGGRALQARATWARGVLGNEWPDVSDEALSGTASDWLAARLARATGVADLRRTDPTNAVRAALGRRAHELDRLAPSTLELPGGRKVAVDYASGQPRISARAQDLFGITVHPMVAGGRVPVTVEVLSPAGRPIQVTADLPAFWQGSWQHIRKEMAGRYPKHAWPADPVGSPPPNRRSKQR
ncbi:MAG: ATP-dependent helicase HrpB [Acidobacteriota bacterium]|nr:ATP-dependent helicase HrpB [Acidobacteriota bacterium]